ncbi:hypothetical protein J6Y50_07170 [bacterium]|nr:hypothetical protein [bacterium]
MRIDKDRYFKIYLRTIRILAVLFPILLLFIEYIAVWIFFFVIELFFVPTMFVDELEECRWKIAKKAVAHIFIAFGLYLLSVLILEVLIELGIVKIPLF